MPAAGSNVLAGGDAGAGPGYAASGSFNVVTGRLYLLHVIYWSASTKATVTVTSSGGETVDAITGTDSSAAALNSYGFRFRANGTGSRTVIVTGSVAGLRISYIVDEVTGEDQSGTNGSGAIVQAKANFNAASTNPIVTLDNAVSSPTNVIWGGVGTNGSPASLSPTAGWAQLAETTQIESALTASTIMKVNSQTAQWTQVSAAWCASAVEIKAAAGTFPIVTQLYSTFSNTDAQSTYSSLGPFDVVKDSLLLVWVAMLDVGSAVSKPSTITGITGTTLVEDTDVPITGTTAYRGCLWRGVVGSDQTAQSLTVTYPSAIIDGFSISVLQVPGVDIRGTNGASAIVQRLTNTGTAITAPTVTLSAFADPRNIPIAFGGGQNRVYTPGVNFAQVSDSGAGDTRTFVEWTTLADLTVDATVNSSGSIAWLGLELQAAPVFTQTVVPVGAVQRASSW